MKQTITFGRFCDAFNDMGRKTQFSYNALKALYEMLEECNPDYDLDVVALCCEYSESTYDEIRDNYTDCKGMSNDGVREYLNDRTSVVWHSDTHVLYAQF